MVNKNIITNLNIVALSVDVINLSEKHLITAMANTESMGLFGKNFSLAHNTLTPP